MRGRGGVEECGKAAGELETLGGGLFIGGAREAELAPPATRVRHRGRVCSCMGSGEGNGDAQGGAHGAEEAKGAQGGRQRRREDPKLHCALVFTRRRALVSKRTVGERGLGERRRHGEHAGHDHGL